MAVDVSGLAWFDQLILLGTFLGFGIVLLVLAKLGGLLD